MKKKSLSYVLSVVLLLTLFTGMATSASAAVSATLSVANVQAYPESTIAVDVSLNGATSGLQITLEYDPAVLTPEKIEAGPQCPSGWMVEPSDDLTMGRLVAVSGSFTNETIDGVVARYTYKVNPGAALGSSSLNVVTAILSDDGTDFNATVSSHGSVTVVSSNPDNSSNPGNPSNSGRETVDDPTLPLASLFPFTDVTESDWFYDDVYYMWENDLMNGTSDTLFSPGRTLTRGMVVTVLYRMESEPGTDGLDMPFPDVAEGIWYTDAVKWAADKKIVLGYSDGTFGPDDDITREQMAAILYRYQAFTEEAPPDTAEEIAFADAGDVSDYAKEPVKALVMQGIINGKPNNRFDPKGNATRAEFAAMLHRYAAALA
ncbi:MAG: S-layer homology domain-containing protein [Oscillospiraceae bacterium]|jgi:hypothetical protein|nr:S-layer homology domain-containing protein [Oscillospiraceae bacterium]